MKTLGQQTAWEKLRSHAAAQALANGEITVPVKCSWCSSENIYEDRSKGAHLEAGKPTEYVCVSCGRITKVNEARKLRRQEIQRIIKEGIDPPAHRG